MKKTALTPWRGIAMLAGMVLLSLGACKKDANVNPEDTLTKTSPSVDFKPTALALTSYKSSSAISYTGQSNLTISGLAIQGGSSPCISLSNCSNIHITQCALTNSTAVGIQLYNCSNIYIDYCYFNKVGTGVDVMLCTAGNIYVQNNQFLNIQGPSPHGQAIHFNQVSGAGLVIQNNMIQNIAGQSNTYAMIDCYKTNGTAASPVQIKGNWVLGAGPNSTSGGLQLGYTGGSYITATSNIFVNAGAIGMCVSGGDHMVLQNNTVYSSALSYSNTGISCWAQGGYAITNCTITGNKVHFMKSTGVESDSWIGPSTPTPTGWSANTWGASISASVLPSSIITSNAATVPLSATTTTGSTTTTTTTTSSSTTSTGSTSTGINSLAQIEQDMDLNGEALPYGMPTNYGWYAHGRVGLGTAYPSGAQAIFPWFCLFPTGGVSQATNTRTQIRNVYIYYLSKSTKQWVLATGSNSATGYYNPYSTLTNYTNITVDKRTETAANGGGMSMKLLSGYCFQGWSLTGYTLPALPMSDIAAVWAYCEARLIVDNPSLPDDRSVANLVLCQGGDYKNTSIQTIGGDIAIGRFKKITNSWRAFNMSTLTDAQWATVAAPPVNKFD